MNRRPFEQPFLVTPVSRTFTCSCCDHIGTLTCTQCRAVKYCSNDCQLSHWKEHKSICKQLCNLAEKVIDEEKTLFLYGTGGAHWRDKETTTCYCTQRIKYAYKLLECSSKNTSKLALELSTEHFIDLVWFIRTDIWEIRLTMVRLLLLQDRLQEVYDVMKWWFLKEGPKREYYTAAHDPEAPVLAVPFRWEDHTRPRFEVDDYLSFQSEDMFEDLVHLGIDKFDECDPLFLNNPAVLSLFIMFALKVNLERLINQEVMRFNTFLLGTDPRCSDNIGLQKLRFNYPILSKVFFYAVSTNKISSKIKILRRHQQKLFQLLESQNKHAVPVLLTEHTMSRRLYEARMWFFEKPKCIFSRVICLIRFADLFADKMKPISDRLRTLFAEKFGSEAGKGRIKETYDDVREFLQLGMMHRDPWEAHVTWPDQFLTTPTAATRRHGML